MSSGKTPHAAVRRRALTSAAGLLGLAAASVVAAGPAFAAPGHHRLSSGDILIADQFNNRIVQIDRGHHVVWSFGDGSSKPGPHSVVGPNDAERVGYGLTLISGTGTPAGADPSCPDTVNGCPDNRVILVNQAGRIVWQYGQDNGVSGAGDDQLNTPVQATALPNGHVLITDQANERVIEVDAAKKVVWQYGTTGQTGAADNFLNNPNSAELLTNGNILIADENNNRVIEVNRAHHIVWSYGSPTGTELNGAAFASRLSNGHTLITDSNNNRIVEIDRYKKVVFTFVTTNRPGSNASPLPTRAVRLRNGDTLISDQFNDQVIEVDPHGAIVFTQGQIDTDGTKDGNGFDQLNAPYDAKVIGDFTGLTNPGFFPLR